MHGGLHVLPSVGCPLRAVVKNQPALSALRLEGGKLCATRLPRLMLLPFTLKAAFPASLSFEAFSFCSVAIAHTSSPSNTHARGGLATSAEGARQPGSRVFHNSLRRFFWRFFFSASAFLKDNTITKS